MVHAFNEFLLVIDSFLGSAFWFPYLLLGTGLFFTLYLKFPQIRYFKRGVNLLVNNKKDSDSKGETSPFQALSIALSGTVGTGNIAGVALAVYWGGPAAIFWMWATAFFGMATKMAEVTMSHKYRQNTERGVAGGPMYYMDKRLNWKPIAILFAISAVFCSFGTGSLPQVNTIAVAMEESFGFNRIAIGGVLAILLGAVIIGGIKRIAVVAEKIMPSMAILYLIGAFGVIVYNYDNIIPSFIQIFSDAFTGSAATGGFLGASIAYAFNRGVARGLYSNEAGQGSAPITLSSSQVKNPVEAGYISLLSPFIDTIIICTITGLVILSSGIWSEKHQNNFHAVDFIIVNEHFYEDRSDDVDRLYRFFNNKDQIKKVVPYTGSLTIVNGVADQTQLTILNSRSIAENVIFTDIKTGALVNGDIPVNNGKINFNKYRVDGESLLHSVNLTAMAFTRSIFGEWGRYFVTISVLLFAFSTAIAWSYIGDRSIIYLFGTKGVMPYRIVYIIAFFLAAFQDTTLIWNFSLITIVVMTIPNLLSLLYNFKEIGTTVTNYRKE